MFSEISIKSIFYNSINRKYTIIKIKKFDINQNQL
jgi:hypothetical protein